MEILIIGSCKRILYCYMVLKIQNRFVSYNRPTYKNIFEKLLKNGLKSNQEFWWKCLTLVSSNKKQKIRKASKFRVLGWIELITWPRLWLYTFWCVPITSALLDRAPLHLSTCRFKSTSQISLFILRDSCLLVFFSDHLLGSVPAQTPSTTHSDNED